MRAALLLLLGLCLAGCSGGGAGHPKGAVVASFYPLAWAAEQVLPSSERIVDLTPPGVEPHDVELSPNDVETIQDAKLVIYLGGGFQPAVEDAVGARNGPSVDLLVGGDDPHIWLDPVRFARALRLLARTAGGSASADAAVGELRRLDADYRHGLVHCDRRVIVTAHAAFGQLASRYGLTQLSLAGRSPESEPGPRELEDLIRKVRESGATTVFAEPLVPHAVVDTIAREADARVATLDPIEGLSEERLASGEDYVSVMRDNLAALRKALGCR
jgi:zinc transport system substrate-binding protein